MIGGRVLDQLAMIRIVTGDSIYGQALVSVAVEHGIVLSLPAVGLMGAWAAAPGQALDTLCDLAVVVIDPLDGTDAREAGTFASRNPDTPPDVVHAVRVARRRNWPVVTGDREAVLALDPYIDVESLP